MNLASGKFLKGPFNAETVERALRRHSAEVGGGWDIQHNPDGTHKDVTATTITVAAGETDGNWTGSLIPTTATQDVGGTVARTSTVSIDRPVRNIRLSGNISWGAFADAVSTAPTLTRSGGSLAFDSGATGTWAATARNGVNSCTLTVNGLGSVSTDGAFNAGTSVAATTHLQGSQLRITDGITAPGAQTGLATIYVDTADGDLKVVFADGTVKTIVTD